MPAEVTYVVLVTLASLGPNIRNKQFRRRRGRLCFNSWFFWGGLQSKITWPPALGQSVMAGGPRSEEGLTSLWIKSRDKRQQCWRSWRKYALEPSTYPSSQASHPKAPVSPKMPPQSWRPSFQHRSPLEGTLHIQKVTAMIPVAWCDIGHMLGDESVGPSWLCHGPW